MNYWLIKSEPDAFSLDDFKSERLTAWTGVRNYTARNHLRRMRIGDSCIFYRSVKHPAAIALCQVVKEHYPDPTTDLSAWVAVELRLTMIFSKEVRLNDIKQNAVLQNMILLKMSRLSVQPLTEKEFETLLELGKGLHFHENMNQLEFFI